MSRVIIVAVLSLLVMVGCASEPPTATPTRVPTPTATPKPTATPYVGGPRPIYNVETKRWVTVTPTATRVPPTPVRFKSRVITRSMLASPTSTPVPSTPTPMPTPEPIVPLPTYDDFLALIADFEPLTPENLSKLEWMVDYEDYRIELPNGDVLKLNIKERHWVKSGYTSYRTVSYLNRCFTDDLEHLQVREHMDIRQRHEGWERLEFMRDASLNFYPPESIEYRGQRGVGSLYGIADGRVIHAVGRIQMSSCELLSFGFTEVVKNDDGFYIDPTAESPSYRAQGTVFDIVRMPRPITNEELETGHILCREKDYNPTTGVTRNRATDENGDCIYTED